MTYVDLAYGDATNASDCVHAGSAELYPAHPARPTVPTDANGHEISFPGVGNPFCTEHKAVPPIAGLTTRKSDMYF